MRDIAEEATAPAIHRSGLTVFGVGQTGERREVDFVILPASPALGELSAADAFARLSVVLDCELLIQRQVFLPLPGLLIASSRLRVWASQRRGRKQSRRSLAM